ncbi:MAG: cysteine desulfurase [Microcystis aeruginosa K13-05]|uniref:family 2A encapsulin nanocompartment cargo protein cysteine desulfurase n=1 Tax=unclassified Microcystis TaxID=2643300 RepID=UPI0022BE3B4A|nr:MULTISPECIES: family 2A encapsulin nanocompartment cargo protein cysteine desulfurase [unclassified Microcystis]MCZ8047444.1 family 2A encapsulin nanocompartment cargo protein cysteine desulfurase [Microcystis sp. LE19-41.2A]NCR81971.1 cysteine desulfurase [Microcystis aeruginosa K13-10]NCR86621.1 cysteine desulfurase [Microcystis aeruginosa K13-05]
MTNPELIPEKAGGNLPSVSPPTTAPTEVENISLNPLFQPDLLEHLAQTIIQELQRHDLKAEVAKGLSTDRDYLVPSAAAIPPTLDLPATPATSPAAVGERPTVPLAVPLATPSFYFIEELETKIPDLPAVVAKPEQLVPVAAFSRSERFAIDPLFVPHASGRSVQRPSFFDVHTIRLDFPILQERVNGKPLIWFDNAATTQKPQAVIDRLVHFYSHENSNVHRAAHELAARSTDAYEAARETVRRFLNASSANEIIFVRGTTEGINLVAKSWGQQTLQAGDEIVLTHLEHHANIVPWQQLAAQTGAKLRVVPVDDHGQILLAEYQQLLNSRTKLVAFSHVSNALGTITPAKQIIDLAHRVGAKVLLDGAQSVSHIPIDVQQLGCDWFVFSGHKVFGPTGIGVLYGQEDLLNATVPWQSGGNMIVDVTFERTVYQAAPTRFEAGTGNIADAVGLGTALDYVQQIGLATIANYEHELLEYATAGLTTIPGLRLIGTAADKASVLSFVLEGFDVEVIGQALNREGIAVRAGHHCAQPILRRFGLEATVRPSLAFYNTKAEVDVLVAALERLQHE